MCSYRNCAGSSTWQGHFVLTIKHQGMQERLKYTYTLLNCLNRVNKIFSSLVKINHTKNQSIQLFLGINLLKIENLPFRQ